MHPVMPMQQQGSQIEQALFDQQLQNQVRIAPIMFLLAGLRCSNRGGMSDSAGGGFDFRLSRRMSIRPIQADYLLTHFNEFDTFQLNTSNSTQNNLRLSTGVVFHF